MGGAVGAMAYYTGAAGEPPGQWAGKGAAALGLAGAVDPGVIHRLFHQHIGPEGGRLTPARTKRDQDVEAGGRHGRLPARSRPVLRWPSSGPGRWRRTARRGRTS